MDLQACVDEPIAGASATISGGSAGTETTKSVTSMVRNLKRWDAGVLQAASQAACRHMCASHFRHFLT